MSIDTNENVLTECFVALENCPHEPRGVVSQTESATEAEDDESGVALCPCVARFDWEVLLDVLAGREEEFPELARAIEFTIHRAARSTGHVQSGCRDHGFERSTSMSKIYRIDVTVTVPPKSAYYVEADSPEEACEQHEDGESVSNCDDGGELIEDLWLALGWRAFDCDDDLESLRPPGSAVEVTDVKELEFARKLIDEE
jgi:hypothetical protein